MPRRKPPTEEELHDLLRQIEDLQRSRRVAGKSSVSALRAVFEIADRFDQFFKPARDANRLVDRLLGRRTKDEDEDEIERRLDKIKAQIRRQLPKTPVKVTPPQRAARQALLEELAEKLMGMPAGKHSVPQITRGRGAAVGWSDSTLETRLYEFLSKKRKGGSTD
jgi:hypothetical protein